MILIQFASMNCEVKPVSEHAIDLAKARSEGRQKMFREKMIFTGKVIVKEQFENTRISNTDDKLLYMAPELTKIGRILVGLLQNRYDHIDPHSTLIKGLNINRALKNGTQNVCLYDASGKFTKST